MLSQHDTSVCVLTGQPNYPDGEVFPGYRALHSGWSPSACGAEIVRVPTLLPGRPGRVRRAIGYLSFLLGACLIGPVLLRKHRFDAVLFYGAAPIYLACAGFWLGRIKRAPLAVWVQDLWPENFDALDMRSNSLTRRLLGAASNCIYRNSARLLVSSEAFAGRINARTGRSRGCIHHPNPVELALADSPHEAPPAPPRGIFEILFAGNLGRAQGLPTLVETARLLRDVPDIRFRIVGDGSQAAWLREKVHAQDLDNIVIESRVDAAAMPAYYQRASAVLIMLAPSLAMSLSLPSKTPTCLASGRPLLVSADGETARIVAHAEAGFCTPAGNAPALADAVRRMCALPENQRAAMGAAGRAYSLARYHPDMLAARLRALLDDMQLQTGKPA